MWHHHATMSRYSVVAVLSFAVVLGCSHASSPAATTPPQSAAATQPSPCDQLATHVVSLIPAASGAPQDKVAVLHDAIAIRCSQDQWSADAQKCFIAGSAADSLDSCAKLLTQAQYAALEHDAKAAVEPLAAGNDAAAAAAAPPAAMSTAGAAPAPAAAAAPAAPAAAPAKRATRGAKTTNDPCEGGQ
jgi:hypothetical protein